MNVGSSAQTRRRPLYSHSRKQDYGSEAVPNNGTASPLDLSAHEHPLKSIGAAFVVAPGVTFRGIFVESLLVD